MVLLSPPHTTDFETAISENVGHSRAYSLGRWIGLLATRCAGSALLLAQGRKAELRRRKEKEGAGPAGGGE